MPVVCVLYDVLKKSQVSFLIRVAFVVTPDGNTQPTNLNVPVHGIVTILELTSL